MGKVRLTQQVYKVLGLFTGTQMLQILCSVVRTKLVALWIGAAGVGLFGLFNAAIELLTGITQLGVRTSSVREISVASEGESRRRIIHVVRRWCIYLGVAGMIVTLFLSPLMSLLSFGSMNQWSNFALISVVLLVGALVSGEQAVMQGTGQLRRLALTSLVGTVAALVISVPLLYYGRIRAIVPVLIVYWMVLAAAVMWGRWTHLFRSDGGMSRSEILRRGGDFVRLGIYLSASGAAVWLATYLLMSWINHRAGDVVLGFYQAGNTLVIRYVGVLFAAVSMEFYPRLAAASHSLQRMQVYVNHEIGVILRIGAPMAVLFVFVAPLLVRLLYSSEFLAIIPFITIAIPGVIARAGAWCLSYVLVARGDGKLYMCCEAVSALLYLVLNIVGYELSGITGFGYAFILWYAIYLLMMLIVVRKQYGLRLGRYAWLWLWGSMITVSVAVVVKFLFV